MDTNSLTGRQELCTRLYKVSSWHDTPLVWVQNDHGTLVVEANQALANGYNILSPAYDAQYLLTKLPDELLVTKEYVYYKNWSMSNEFFDGMVMQSGNMCDALIKMALELYKHGILGQEI